MKGYISQYKCRLCGEIHNGSSVTMTGSIVEKHLLKYAYDIGDDKLQQPSELEIHKCDKYNRGVSDFAGWKRGDI